MSKNLHESAFSYNITKPYPFRWFTPLVVAGLLVSAVLFSLLNYVTSGFILINENTSNPNGTDGADGWMQHLPSYFTTNSKSICQPVTLPVGSTLFTNQSALTYTLTAAWQTAPDGANTYAASLPYSNNVLEDCFVWAIGIDLESFDALRGNQMAFVEWIATVNSYITCSIYGPNGKQKFNLTQAYNYVPESVPIVNVTSFLATNFISRNRETRASLWWGETLLSLYWDFLTFDVRAITWADRFVNRTSVYKGGLQYTPRLPYGKGDLADLSFFNLDYRFLITPDTPHDGPVAIWPESSQMGENGNDASWLIKKAMYPNIWETADKLAKAAWSTVLTDLGQVSVKPNILTDPNLLKAWSAQVGNTTVAINIINPIPGPATEPYLTSGYTTGPLKVTPSTFSAEYLCQVPKRKSIGNLILTIVVADLVLLQALWQLYKLLVDTFFLNTDYDQQHSPPPNGPAGLGLKIFKRNAFQRIVDPTEEEMQPMARLPSSPPIDESG